MVDRRDPVAWANPLTGNPFADRHDVEQAMRDLYEPLVPYVSAGGARVRLGTFGASFPPVAAELEGFARPLWGLAPLAAGGGRFDHWDRVRDGMRSGTDPAHPEYWGATGNRDQRMVEMAAIGAGLLLAPGELWDPLDGGTRARLAAWLQEIDRREPVANNWQFFRVLVDLGLRRVGVDHDEGAHRSSLAVIEACALDGGWYGDGPDDGRVDWYGPFAFHTYGLLYAASGLGEPVQADRYRERAAAFAQDHRHWFGPDGAALAFGRSMTYRFAQAAFWGALAVAGVEAVPWGQAKGLYLRNLRHWGTRPISDRDGVLSVGYGYDNRVLAERYNSPGSPYWACKAFLALAAPDDHPFWTAEEEPFEPAPAPVVQPVPGMVLSHGVDQVLAISARQQPPAFVEQAEAKYARFAYSSAFGFGADVTAGDRGRASVSDSTLSLTDRGGVRRVRGVTSEFEIDGDLLASRWEPWPGVVVETVLWGRAPWHARAHHIRTDRHLEAHEWGFALGFERSPGDRSGLDPEGTGHRLDRQDGAVAVTSAVGRAGLVDLTGGRASDAVVGPPNIGLEWPAVVVPVLAGEIEPGEHIFVTLAFGAGVTGAGEWDTPPEEPPGLLALLRRRAGLGEADGARRPASRAPGRAVRPGPGNDGPAFDSLRPMASRLRGWLRR